MHKKTLRNLFILFIISYLLMPVMANTPEKYEEGKIYKHELDNGLVIYTLENHIAPLIFHQLTYKVGSRNEQLGITGLSHIVEHMMFKGTEKYGKGEVSKVISANAGIFNAFTMKDMTSYYEYLPKNKIEVALDIESDRMQNSIFDPDEFESEIEVILQERRMRSESNPSGIARETLNSIAYCSHPNRDPIIGWPTDISNVTRDRAYEYYKTYYTPNNAFLFLIGDFETDEMVALVDKYYGKVPRGPEVEEPTLYEEEQKVRKSYTLRHSDISKPYFQFAFHVPTYDHPDAPALKMAGKILCERSRDARLYKRLVDEERIATMAAGGFGLSKDPGLFTISVSMKPKKDIDKAEEIVWEEIALMQNELVSEHELQKVKNRHMFDEITSGVKNGDIGSRLSRYEAYFGWELKDKFIEDAQNVTREDIKRVMNTYFDPDKVTVGYHLPKEDASGNSDDKKQELEEEADESYDFMENEDAFFYQLPIDWDVIRDDMQISLDDDELIRPRPVAPLIHTTTLDNGITLHTIESHLVPDFNVIGIFETGLIEENLDGQEPGVINFLTDIMNRGTETMSYDELTERMAFVPFSFGIGGSHKSIYFQGYSLVKDIDEMMKVGFDYVTKPAFDTTQIEKQRSRHLIKAKNRLKKTGMQAFYYMYNKIFNGHPLSQYYSTPESVEKYNRESLVDLHEKYFRPERLTLLMIGDRTHDQMKEIANKYYGDWKEEGSVAEIVEMPKVEKFEGKEIKIYPENDYTECTINIGFAPYNDFHPDDEEIYGVLNYILASSALTSRMGVELRDKNGWIYGIKSQLWETSDGIGYWKFNTKTGPENCENVIRGIFSEIRKLLKDGVTDEELQTAKNRKLGLLPFYIETPDDAAQILFNCLQDDLPFDHFDKKAERILSITKDDVMRLAKKYFTLDNFIIVVDGPIEEDALDGIIDEL